MRLVKKLFILVLFIIIVLAAINFLRSNADPVAVKLFGFQTKEMPLYLVSFISFAIGFILIALISIGEIIRAYLKNSKLKKIIGELEERLMEKNKLIRPDDQKE